MEPFLGQIMIVGFNFAPRGWAMCDGQLLPISQNTALFSLLGTTYGGDGRTSFGLPDLRGRSPLHVGNGPGLTNRSWGQRVGKETHTLQITEIPSHTHDSSGLKMQGSSNQANTDEPDGSVFAVGAEDIYREAAADSEMHNSAITGNLGNTGGSQAHNIMQPTLALYHVIALTGIFPSRS